MHYCKLINNEIIRFDFSLTEPIQTRTNFKEKTYFVEVSWQDYETTSYGQVLAIFSYKAEILVLISSYKYSKDCKIKKGNKRYHYELPFEHIEKEIDLKASDKVSCHLIPRESILRKVHVVPDFSSNAEKLFINDPLYL